MGRGDSQVRKAPKGQLARQVRRAPKAQQDQRARQVGREVIKDQQVPLAPPVRQARPV